MDYYCDVCDKTIKINSQSKPLKSVTHNEFEKCVRIKHTIENPDFFALDSIFKDYITNHNKRFDLYVVESVFNLVFDTEFHPHIRSDLLHNTFSYKKVFIT